MTSPSPHNVLLRSSNPQQLAHKATADPRLLEVIIQGLKAKEARAKYGCAKALRLVSEERPDLLYPYFDFFVHLLDSENKIFRWEGIFVLSQLARVDVEDKFIPILDRYCSPIPGPVMITAANVIRGGARIARVKPHLVERIASEILRVSRARYQTPECRNVAIGHAILALGDFFGLIMNKNRVVQFVRRQLKNSRPATRKKAAQFLKQRHLDSLASRRSITLRSGAIPVQ